MSCCTLHHTQSGNITTVVLCRIDTAKPRPTPVRSPSQMSRSASSRSVRAGASKPAGYDNPLFTTGDILGDRETDSADVMPLVVGDHAVLTPRRPESPLVAKLKAQATEKGHKLRQDRILVRLGWVHVVARVGRFWGAVSR